MLTSAQILDGYLKRVTARTGKSTNYRAAKEIGVEHVTINQWKKGITIGAKNAVKIGVYCEIDTRYLVACLESERARDPITRGFWAALSKSFAPDKKALDRFAKGMPAQPGKLDLSTSTDLLSPQLAGA